MQNVSHDWQDTNRDFFTRQAAVLLSITQTGNGVTPIIGGSSILSFTHDKTGDILSGILTQDKITAVINDPTNRLNFTDEDGNSIYKNARVQVTEGFLRQNSSIYEGADGGVYYISSVDQDSYQRKYTITAAIITAFMTEKLKDVTGRMRASDLLGYVIDQAEDSQYVPSDDIAVHYDSCLHDIWVEYDASDSYSLAECLQLIASACSCVMWVDRKGIIQIQKLGTICEHYVLAGRILYSPLTVEFADRVGNIELTSNHGHTITHTTFEGDNIGALQQATNVILNDDNVVIPTALHMYSMLTTATKKYTAQCRVDPALDLFDMIHVPYGNKVFPACVVGIEATFNGAWKGTIKAVTMGSGVMIDLRICDLEMLTIEQLESLTIEQLEPNTISDIDGDYMASKFGELAYWNGDD